MKAEKKLTMDEILALVNGGLDIYTKEGFYPNKTFNSPFRIDKNASCSISNKIGIWFFKDFATGEALNPWQFIQKRYNITLKEAVKKVKYDFNLSEMSPVKYEIIQQYNEVVKKAKEEQIKLKINFSITKFDRNHHKYWNDYHLSEDFLRKNNVYRVSKLWIAGKKISLKPDELTFAYHHQIDDTCKILRIGVEKKDKWRTNCPGSTLWFKEDYDTCDKLIISKSVKDALVLKSLDLCSTATQNESDSSIRPNIDWIRSCGRSIYLNFGTDSQGKQTSYQITREFGFLHYNTPDNLLPEVNDFAEWYKNDRESAIKHLIQKRIL